MLALAFLASVFYLTYTVIYLNSSPRLDNLHGGVTLQPDINNNPCNLSSDLADVNSIFPEEVYLLAQEHGPCICSAVRNQTVKQTCEEYYWYYEAEKQKDANLCNNMSDPVYIRECMASVTAGVAPSTDMFQTSGAGNYLGSGGSGGGSGGGGSGGGGSGGDTTSNTITPDINSVSCDEIIDPEERYYCIHPDETLNQDPKLREEVMSQSE